MRLVAPRITLPTDASGLPVDGSPIDEAYNRFAAAAVRQNHLDPLTSELVRLRCGLYHQCRVCSSLRDVDALEAGFDESLTAKIPKYEESDLAENYKVALRLTDAMIIRPLDVDEQLRIDVARYYSPEQIQEILFDVVKWSFQKALISLRMDAAPREGLSELRFDQFGNPTLGGSVRPS